MTTATSSTRPIFAPAARAVCRAAVAVILVALVPGVARAQLGALASPGPLSSAHAKLEGIAQCQECHEPGRQVTAAKCLTCHKPIAQRIAQKKGLHREVTTECAMCHVEHNGRDAELRPFETKGFDHKTETGFALDGKHVGVACAKCHKTRSFLNAKPDCASCHTDSHKGSLGSSCDKCHTTTTPFKETAKQFDHTKTAFQLTGRHQQVACAKCHVGNKFKGLQFSTCASCHTDPHAKKLGTDCTTCHTTAQWKTTKVDHARTAFPLRGKHETVACVKCHVQSPVKVRLKFAKCADCHKDPHAGRFKETCETCHKETGFGGATFDHKARTKFELTGRHAKIECSKCHKSVAPKRTGVLARTVDFGGLKTDCQSCHEDPHKGTLGPTCTTCHGTDTFRLTTFKHPRMPEFFAGEHAKPACAACHARDQKPGADGKVPVAAMRFKNVPTTCTTCHKDVHLGQLGTACETCHRIDAPKFAAPGFSHERSAFKLTGKHQQVDCAKCHVTVKAAFPAGTGEAKKYKGLATDCASCHKDVHLGQLGKRCDACHKTDGFAVRTYTHVDLKGFFVGAHERVECVKCHKREDGIFPAGRGVAVRYLVGKECSSCHKDAHAGSMGKECSSCHTPDMWRNPSRAFHKTTQFPLTGRHLAVACESCHLQGQLKGTPTRCYDCHWVRRQDDRYKTRLGNECEDCHRTTSWTAVNWNHGARTGTPLNIAHRLLACDSCHKDAVFEGRRPECIACHERDYRSAKSPDHVAAGFPFECQMCHPAASPTFGGGRFTHASYTLRGVHATQTCNSCHGTGVYQGTPRDCYSCHRSDYEKTTRPGHASAGFPTACETCHREGGPSWASGSGFNHSQYYQLAGAHQTADCVSCHANGVFKGTPRDCYSCHQNDYQRTRNPNHVSGHFSTACETCHRAGGPGWATKSFRHTAAFPLSGVHAATACIDCHRDGVYKGRSQACVSCHQDDYQRTANPNHASAGFPTACEQCHRSGGPGWGGGSFNHNSFFALAGTHQTTACASCHKNGVYKGTPRDCYACHQPDYQRTANPNHASAGFPTTCEQCHRSGGPGWGSGSFNHNSFFALSGTHQSTACASCHKNGVYKGTPRDCYGCHQPDYQRTANPNHASAGFPTTCEQCHRSGGPGWGSGSFNHNSFFALAGTHQTTACTSCHTNGVYKGTPRDCYACHQTQYQRTTNPNHASAGFPTTCEQCHRSGGPGWGSGSFNHNSFFALAGTHQTTSCTSCHTNGVYKGTPRDCYACHQTQYQRTTNPNHASAGFPTTCEQCHRSGGPGWGSGSFNHNSFFALAGTHQTTACTSCHRNGVYKGTPRDCYACHQTQYQRTTNPNHASAGFPTACDQCHRSGGPGWTGASFNHSQFFALVGRHATQPCSACHRNNVYRGTPRDCVGCHLADYNGTRDPNHASAGFPTTCETCHRATDTSWDQGTFNHTWFPIASGRHSGNPCSACHQNTGNYQSFTCLTCHTRADTDDEHSGRAGYRYESTACYSCHPTGRGD